MFPSTQTRRQGSLRPLGHQKWLIRISYGFDPTGKRVRSNAVVYGSKRDAQRVLNERLQQKDEGMGGSITRQTLCEWIEEWLANWRNEVTSRTRDDTRVLLKRYLPAELSVRRLSTLTPSHLQVWVNSLSARGLSPRTVRMAHGALRCCLNRAVKIGKVSRNVATLIDLPKARHREMQYLTTDQALCFLKAAEGTPWHALFVVMLTTGLRPGEALGLQWSDFDGTSLRIRRALLRTGELASTKTGRNRLVALDTRTINALKQHRTRQAEWRLRLGASYQDRNLIFPSEYGTPADAQNIVNRHFKPLLHRANLPAIRFYDLRHSAATLLFSAGEDMKTVQERLGHASITLTLNTYTHVADEIRQRTAMRLDTLFDQAQARSALH